MTMEAEAAREEYKENAEAVAASAEWNAEWAWDEAEEAAREEDKTAAEKARVKAEVAATYAKLAREEAEEVAREVDNIAAEAARVQAKVDEEEKRKLAAAAKLKKNQGKRRREKAAKQRREEEEKQRREEEDEEKQRTEEEVKQKREEEEKQERAEEIPGVDLRNDDAPGGTKKTTKTTTEKNRQKRLKQKERKAKKEDTASTKTANTDVKKQKMKSGLEMSDSTVPHNTRARSGEPESAQDEISSVLSPPSKHQTHIKTPNEADRRLNPASGEAAVPQIKHDVFVNGDVGNTGVEVEVLGHERSTEIHEFGSQLEINPRCCSENKEEFYFFQTSDLGIEKEARQGDGAGMSELLGQPHSVEEDQEQSTEVYGSATATTTLQLQTPNAMPDVMNQLRILEEQMTMMQQTQTVVQEQMTSVNQKLSVMQEQMTKMVQERKKNLEACDAIFEKVIATL